MNRLCSSPRANEQRTDCASYKTSEGSRTPYAMTAKCGPCAMYHTSEAHRIALFACSCLSRSPLTASADEQRNAWPWPSTNVGFSQERELNHQTIAIHIIMLAFASSFHPFQLNNYIKSIHIATVASAIGSYSTPRTATARACFGPAGAG